MNQVEKAIADALVANVAARRRWDEPAELYWVSLAKGRIKLSRIPSVQSMFAISRPAVVLSTLAQAAADRRHEVRRSIRPGICGVAFFAEAWKVQYATDEEVREAVNRRDTEPLSAHPRRVEQRVMSVGGRTST